MCCRSVGCCHGAGCVAVAWVAATARDVCRGVARCHGVGCRGGVARCHGVARASLPVASGRHHPVAVRIDHGNRPNFQRAAWVGRSQLAGNLVNLFA